MSLLTPVQETKIGQKQMQEQGMRLLSQSFGTTSQSLLSLSREGDGGEWDVRRDGSRVPVVEHGLDEEVDPKDGDVVCP